MEHAKVLLATNNKENANKLMLGSLERLQTDYVDVLFCPHGAALPETMDSVLEKFLPNSSKKDG